MTNIEEKKVRIISFIEEKNSRIKCFRRIFNFDRRELIIKALDDGTVIKTVKCKFEDGKTLLLWISSNYNKSTFFIGDYFEQSAIKKYEFEDLEKDFDNCEYRQPYEKLDINLRLSEMIKLMGIE